MWPSPLTPPSAVVTTGCNLKLKQPAADNGRPRKGRLRATRCEVVSATLRGFGKMSAVVGSLFA